jgi:ABC-type uncharacterized transport system fused permease/ATPase subunit
MVLIYLNSEGDILTLQIYFYHNLLGKIGHTSLIGVKWKVLKRFYSHIMVYAVVSTLLKWHIVVSFCGLHIPLQLLLAQTHNCEIKIHFYEIT